MGTSADDRETGQRRISLGKRPAVVSSSAVPRSEQAVPQIRPDPVLTAIAAPVAESSRTGTGVTLRPPPQSN
jgi:hypothetical protein